MFRRPLMANFICRKWLSRFGSAAQRRPHHSKRRKRPQSAAGRLEQLEDRVVPTVLDLTTPGASGMLNGAVFSQLTQPSGGSGTINTFAKLSTNNAVEQGYNTDF